MDDVSIDRLPVEDHDEVRRFTESHGGAIVLRVGVAHGSDAKREMLRYRKQHGDLPAYDFAWCVAPSSTLASSGGHIEGGVHLWKPGCEPEDTQATKGQVT